MNSFLLVIFFTFNLLKNKTDWSHKKKKGLLVEFIEHFVRNLFWTGPVNFYDLFVLWEVRVQSSKLISSVAKQNQKVFGIRWIWSTYFFQDSIFGITIHYTRKHAVLDRVHDDITIWFNSWLFVQPKIETIKYHEWDNVSLSAKYEFRAKHKQHFSP